MSTLFVDENGSKKWVNDKGELHRIGGAAVEGANGDKYWYFEGKQHRIDGPAIEWIEGDKWWYFEGKLHRIDGPAIEYVSGNKEYWYCGERIECSSIEEFLELIKIKIFW